MVNRNYLTIILLLFITIYISWGLYFHDYQHEDTINIRNFPSTVDEWTSQDLPVDKSDLDVLETKNVFLRRYTNKSGKSVYLYIAYSQSNQKASNPPEIVYQNSDISILDKGKKYIIIASSELSFKVNWLQLDNDENQQIVYYWFKVGDVYTRSYWKEQALTAFNNLSGRKTGNALIRVSTDIINGNQTQAIDLINSFTCLIIPQLFKHLP